ncbi:MAG: hypothetical protein AAFZ38_00690 [Myxococcota bacterium]
MQVFRRTVDLIALLVLAQGCATSSERPPVKLSGTVIRATPDPTLELESYDAPSLFHLAGESDRRGDADRALELYRRMREEFPTDPLVIAARFNAGLIHENHERYELALREYDAILAREAPGSEPDRQTWLDAHFRVAACHIKREAWWRAVAVFETVGELDDLPDRDRLEALVGKGIALESAGDREAAMLSFSHALGFFRLVSRRRRFDDRGFAAEAAFRSGEIAHTYFDEVQLRYPLHVLKQSLDEKCRLLLLAQNHYLQAIRYGDTHSVAVAGHRIGNLYEDLYESMIALEVPADVDASQVDVYREEVRNRVAVLVEKAIRVYEKALLAGRRTASAASWVEQTEAALARLRAIYLADAAPLPGPE